MSCDVSRENCCEAARGGPFGQPGLPKTLNQAVLVFRCLPLEMNAVNGEAGDRVQSIRVAAVRASMLCPRWSRKPVGETAARITIGGCCDVSGSFCHADNGHRRSNPSRRVTLDSYLKLASSSFGTMAILNDIGSDLVLKLENVS